MAEISTARALSCQRLVMFDSGEPSLFSGDALDQQVETFLLVPPGVELGALACRYDTSLKAVLGDVVVGAVLSLRVEAGE